MTWQQIYRTWSPLVALWCLVAGWCGHLDIQLGGWFIGNASEVALVREIEEDWIQVFFWGEFIKQLYRWFQRFFSDVQPILGEMIQFYQMILIFFNLHLDKFWWNVIIAVVYRIFLKSLPKTNNIAPGRRPYQKETHLQPSIFAVSGRVGMTFFRRFLKCVCF